jgi:uroporphyrinogen decarboxylase
LSPLKNDLLLRALRGEPVSRPPVWMMRQAGRYLPDYMKLRRQYDFFTRVRTPELACEITLQPIDQIGVDAAIIFSDILVVPQAMGMEVLMEEGKGPLLPKTIQSAADVASLITDVSETNGALRYVSDALRLTRRELNGRVPLIGFAGAPWTLLCYMVEGKGSKTFDKAKAFCYTQPEAARLLLQKITDVTIAYLTEQASAGADLLQVFDSWSGMLGPDDFNAWSLPYLQQIVTALQDKVPVILFPKGSWYALEQLGKTGAVGLGIDWTMSAAYARQTAGSNITLQGNFDPARLLMPIPELRQAVHKMINDFGSTRYIANLGHGILPNIPVAHARAFVDAVKEWEPVQQ